MRTHDEIDEYRTRFDSSRRWNVKLKEEGKKINIIEINKVCEHMHQTDEVVAHILKV